jgi:tetratricopeptide (TPR) repeat protein
MLPVAWRKVTSLFIPGPAGQVWQKGIAKMEVTKQDDQLQGQPPGRHAGHDALEYIKHNIQVVSIAGGLTILVAVIFVAYIAQQRRSVETASRMLGVAQSSKQLEELLAQYPSSPAAPIAMLALASEQFKAAAYDQAVMLYVRFLRQYPKHPMAAAAELGKVMCFEARGESDHALTGFNMFIQAHPGSFLLPQAQMGRARCLQQLNRVAEAKAVYEDFIAANPESDWKPQMEMALDFIERDTRGAQNNVAPGKAVGPFAAPEKQ